MRRLATLCCMLATVSAAGTATAETLNLRGYRLTFDDEFNTRSISQTGAATVWADIRATSRFDVNSDIGFGASSFMDPASGFDPFNVAKGALTIRGVPHTVPFGYPTSWQSGLLHTEATFVQSYGYFEMRARLSSVPGTWPAFWLLPVSMVHPAGRDPSQWQELDVVEQYGVFPQGVYSNIHTTEPAPAGQIWNFFSAHPEIASGYHTYGMDWEPDRIAFYVDGVLMGIKPEPDDMSGPMYMLVDLARDTPYRNAASPMTMAIDYVRAFSKDPRAVAVVQQTVSAPDGHDPGLYGAAAASALPSDRLTIHLEGHGCGGGCRILVGVDGVPLGGVQAVAGARVGPQAFTVPANLPRGVHTVSIALLGSSADRTETRPRLRINGVRVNGDLRGGASTVFPDGPQTYVVSIP